MFSKDSILQIEKDFQIALKNLPQIKEQLNNLFINCSEQQIICMKFYYAYMPISDIISYSPSLFLKIVKDTLYIKEILNWDIDEELFLNYVLSYRINNENIVDYRKLFFDELYDRIKDKNMHDAALEVNYWCFEKATYKSTDIRTASPLTVIKNAFGRCGEESTLCVAALRSVGIPARQCYTPRWSHCDDNHAWVEVYVDGAWHFIGACEPEPVMDKGWFVSSAQRAMLIHSRVFSALVKKDIITNQTPKITEVNLLNRYTDTKALKIKVVKNNLPLSDIKVQFEVINYSELYPIAALKTDKNGECQLVTGLGDLFVHITDNKRFMYQKADMRKTDFIIFDFDNSVLYDDKDFELDMCCPIQKPLDEIEIDEQQLECHNKLIKQCVDKRKAYENTFYNKQKADEFLKEYNLNDLSDFLIKSNGNYKEIIDFIQNDNFKLDYKIMLLKTLKDKDFSDITSDILIKHLYSALKYKDYYDEQIFKNYILCPRIYTEMITDYKQFIFDYFDNSQVEAFKSSPAKIFDYINDNIEDCKDNDYSTLISSPCGTLKFKIGSEISKKVLFVAICRTFGIPARINPVDLCLQYYDNEWIDIIKKDLNIKYYNLKLESKDLLEYNKNFSIAVLNSGIYQNLDLADKKFEDRINYDLPSGYYRIVTSNRQINGDILAKAYHINLNKQTKLYIELRQNDDFKNKIVDIDDIKLKTLDGKQQNLSQLLLKDKNIIAWLEEGKEPTEHLLNEMLDKKETFKNMNVIFVVKAPNAIHNPTLKHTLDEINNIAVLIDFENYDKNKIYNDFEILDKKLPLTIVINQALQAVFCSAGYNVGIADMLLKAAAVI